MRQTMLRILMLLLLCIGLSFPTHADDRTLLGTDLDAATILATVDETYSSVDTYRDTGTVAGKTSILGMEIGWFDEAIRFSTAFVRPDRFRFEFEYQRPSSAEWHQYVVQADSSGARTKWDVNPGIEPAPSLRLAVAGATGVSRAAAHTIPALLLPDIVGGWRITDIESVSVTRNQVIEGREYLRIRGEHPSGSPVIIWIDPDTHLIRRVETRSTILLIVQIDWTIVFDSEFDTPIDPAELRL